MTGVSCTMTNEELRTRSGNVNASSRLTSFLYDLMRDHLTPGVVEKLVQGSTSQEVSYTNGWLARYAFDLTVRLVQDSELLEGDVLSLFQVVAQGSMTPEEATKRVFQALRTESRSKLPKGFFKFSGPQTASRP